MKAVMYVLENRCLYVCEGAFILNCGSFVFQFYFHYVQLGAQQENGVCVSLGLTYIMHVQIYIA